MKVIYIVSIMLCFGFVMCNTEDNSEVKLYTVDEIIAHTGGRSSVNQTYERSFIPYSDKYSLSNIESRIVGNWYSIEYYEKPTPRFTFYPNKFFIGNNDSKWYKISDNVNITDKYGIWNVKENKLYVTVYGCIERDLTKGNSGGIHFKSVEPYKIELIDLSYMADIGYMKIPFAMIPLPKEYNGFVKVGGVEFYARCYRTIFQIRPIGNGGASFGDLRYIPFMAEKGITAEQLVSNTQFTDMLFSDMKEWGSYDSLHEKDPIKYPKL
jgi:hypothetical protein